MTEEKLKTLLDHPKKLERAIRKEILIEYEKQFSQFVLDRLFIQLNQE
jgi:hypothetical protein